MNRALPLLAISLMTASAVSVVLVAGRPPAAWSPAEPTPTPPAASPVGRPIEVVISTRWSPVQGYARSRTFAQCLEAETGRPVSLLQRGTYAEANALIASGRGQIALVCSGATADPRLRAAMSPVFRLDSGGTGNYHSVLVTSADDPATGLVSLGGASVAWTDPDSLTGYRAPRAAVRELGEDPDAYFGMASFTHSHDASLDAVAQGLVRIAAVDEEIFRAHPNPAIKVVWRSVPFPAPPILVRPGDAALTAALTALAHRPECLAEIGATGLVPTNWESYDILSATIENGR